MRNDRLIEIEAFTGISLAGSFLFIWTIVLSDAVPTEYRSASPGFGWSWDFDYADAMRGADRLGAEPWPWLAKETGNRFVLPLNQSLLSDGLKITYRGMSESGGFRLDMVIQGLDPSVVYMQHIDITA